MLVLQEEYKSLAKWWKEELGAAVEGVKVSKRLATTPCVVVSSKVRGWVAEWLGGWGADWLGGWVAGFLVDEGLVAMVAWAVGVWWAVGDVCRLLSRAASLSSPAPTHTVCLFRMYCLVLPAVRLVRHHGEDCQGPDSR